MCAKMSNFLAIALSVVIFCVTINGIAAIGRCMRTEHAKKSLKMNGDGGYRVFIDGEPKGYQPGKIYNVFLVAPRANGEYTKEFTNFRIYARAISNADKSKGKYTTMNPRRVGRFQLFDDPMAEFNIDCVNILKEADEHPKSEVQFMWVAPPTGSGCIALSAMVNEKSQSWYADADQLTKIICEGGPMHTNPSEECCACDEAKYQLTFEGIWSNETHPRDFPFAVWLTHFSDVIGATHDGNFSFWGENHIATDAFKSLAEFGSVRALDFELRSKGSRLRTLIKAAGLWYPSVNTNTSANFRTDRIHHKLSVVSMFGPSPDWVVGVSGLNLCEMDCTWKDSLDIDLYPWDAGTDNGITYMSPNSETFPRERMYRITTMFPEDPRQPFYNSNSSEMTPLARLYIRKIKTFARNCDDQFLQSQVLDISENTEDETSRPECAVSEYTQWSPCSVTCGKGIRSRTRHYLNENSAKSANCNRQLISKEMCVATINECSTDDEDDRDENLGLSEANVDSAGEGIGVCRTTPWTNWSPCSASCGIGISMRTRTFIDHSGRKKCPHISIVEKNKCMQPECSADDIEIPDPLCPVTQWSDWSPCSKTCGQGVTIRTRLFLGDESKREGCKNRKQFYQQKECSQREECAFSRNEAREICSMSADEGPCRGTYNRFAFDRRQNRCVPFNYGGCRGNANNFFSLAECQKTCNNI